MNSVEAPVSQTLILLCEKCGKKLSKEDDENLTRKLQKVIKEELSENQEKSKIRALVTSCMNLCPEGKIATCLVSIDTGSVKFFEQKVNDVEESAQKILHQARRLEVP